MAGVSSSPFLPTSGFAALSARRTQAVPLQGTVDGIPKSWVRVTRSPTGLRGMVFDGQDMYAIEPAAEAAAVTVQPLDTTAGDTVVYRLSDALHAGADDEVRIARPDVPVDVGHRPRRTQWISSLRSCKRSRPPKPPRRNRCAWASWATSSSSSSSRLSTPEDAIVARMNIVDGIFSTQLGIKISLATPTLFRTSSDPFTKSRASDLLSEVSSYRNSTPAQRALGITHLMTGRDLETATVGIAYMAGLCDPQCGRESFRERLEHHAGCADRRA